MATRKPARKPSRRGRPPAAPAAPLAGDARRRLLDAAARLFAAGGFAGTSLRQVAREADVTPAMVSYYFRDKDGLLEAVLTEGVELILGALRGALTGPAEQDPLLPRFVHVYLATLTAHPWIPRIIVQEVISRDTPLRQLFVDRFARQAVTLVAPRLQDEMRAGRLRGDLDVRLTVMSVIGMCVFPYIAEPLLGRLLDYRIDPDFLEAFVPHTVALLEDGLRPAP
jgi:TetR/AcrR family transcriptional regulator